ncbi:MAG: alanine racemase [Patescibacteria group bacterium]
MPIKDEKTWIEVSKSALARNVKEFRSQLGKSVAIMAVVKSNAYGHGLVLVAKTLENRVDWFGVDNVNEGLELRKNGIKKPILILGYTQRMRLTDCMNNNLSFCIYNKETVLAIKNLLKEDRNNLKKAKVHIKIETGTTRQGIENQELHDLAKSLKSCKNILVEGAYTHYANIEDTTDHFYARSQLKRYKDALKILSGLGVEPAIKHTACSAAAILFPETYFNLVRVGISLYGLWSSKETQAVARQKHSALKLTPALTWKTIVAQIKNVQKGTAVSYGLTEKTTRKSRLAVIPVGYWDGLDRKLSSVGSVLINGTRCKIVGRICMNMCLVDVTEVKDLKLENEVVILGKQKNEKISAEEIAGKVGTINYEIITRINPMIKRIVH